MFRWHASVRRISGYASFGAVAAVLVASTGIVGAASVRQSAPMRTPKIAGTFTQALSEDPKTLDPDHMTLADEDTIAANIGAALVAVSPQGKVVPWLAKSWTFSNNGKTLTFNLRPGVTFQASGDPLTAQDIQWTYDRDLNPKTLAPVAASELGGIKKIEAPNASTLVFQLTTPNGSILENLADAGYLAPVDPAQYKKYGDKSYGQHPSSVGPYELQTWVPGQSVTLVRNPKYTWAPSYDKKGAPYIKNMVFDVIPQPSSQLAALASGQINLLAVPPQNWNQYANNPKYSFYSGYNGRLITLNYNLTEPMFQSLKVRQAINMALNRKAFVSAVLLGHGTAGWSPFAPNLLGYDKATVNYYPYNVKKAKSLLEQAGYTYKGGNLISNGQPVKLNLMTRTDWPYPTSAELAQAQLKAIGIQTTITSFDVSTEESKLLAAKPTYDLAIFGYAWSGADPVTLMQIMLAPNGGLNTAHFSSPAFTAMMNKYVSSTNATQRRKLVYALQMQYLKAAPYASIAYVITGTAVTKGFKGVEWDAFASGILLDNAYVG